MSDEALRWSMAPYKKEGVVRWLKTPTLIHIAAEYDDEIVGFVCIEKINHPKRKGIGYLGTYFHRDFADVNLEPRMMQNLLHSARQEGISKVKAEVVADDEDTIKLLEKYGFELEGRLRDDFYGEDGRFHDVIAMGRLLDDEPASVKK
jgi:putative acetyltransferase